VFPSAGMHELLSMVKPHARAISVINPHIQNWTIEINARISASKHIYRKWQYIFRMEENYLLLKIYIGQEINSSRGILYDFRGRIRFSEKENEVIKSLEDKKLVKIVFPYTIKSIRTLVTTRDGKRKSRKLIQQILNSDSKLLHELYTIPQKVLGFLLVNLDYAIFEKTRSRWIRDWKDFILHSSQMFDFSITFCQILQKHKLSVLTNDYVSSDGGRIDPEKYVIANEVREHLTRNLKLIPFNYEEINRSILFYIINKIKKEILPIKSDARRRNSLWNLLRVLPIDESAIKSLIGKFKDENITTAYSEIDNEQFLFEILDESRFEVKLGKLVDDFVSEIIRGRKKEAAIPMEKAAQPFKLHSELFALIGNFEIGLRNYLLKEMQTAFKEDKKEWYNQLRDIKLKGNYSPFKTIFDKLESRRNEDLRNKILPEDELIYYADITDYKDIILKNWKIFANKFGRIRLSKEKFEHGMNELNKIRRKVMHLRDIRPHEAKTLRLYIILELERMFQ